MAYHLGVDLGTTFAAAAVIQAGRAEVFQLGDHRPQVPSAVFRTRTDDYLVGDAAIRAGTTDPSRLAAEFKRRMGDDVSILLGGAPMPPHLLMSVLLRWVVAAVTAGQGGPPESVMVTHPANWGEYRRELLAQAAAEADLVRVRFCTEPEAAAMHFASVNRVSPGAYVAVYDLGGGTFDAAVLRHEQDGSFGMVGTPQGIEHLGGIDFDEALLDHVRNTVDLSGADVTDRNVLLDLARLRRECTEAKEYLSAASDTELSVSVGATRALIRLTRADLESSVRPALLQTVATLARTVKQAGLEVDELEAVVLVGGSSRIPLVTELLVRELGRPVRLSPHPKHCVALGAAVFADLEAQRIPFAPLPADPAPVAGRAVTLDPGVTDATIDSEHADDTSDANAEDLTTYADQPTVRPFEYASRHADTPMGESGLAVSDAPGTSTRLSGTRNRALIGAVAATVLVAAGAVALATLRPHGGPTLDPVSRPTMSAVASSKASATPSPANPSPNSTPAVLTAGQARAQLDALRANDAGRVKAMLDGRWVAQLSSKSDGITDDLETTSTGSHTFHWVDILEQQQTLRKEPRLAGDVVSLLSTQFGGGSTWRGRPLYVMVADKGFGSERAVRTWCSKTFSSVSKAERENSCAARKFTRAAGSTTRPRAGEQTKLSTPQPTPTTTMSEPTQEPTPKTTPIETTAPTPMPTFTLRPSQPIFTLRPQLPTFSPRRPLGQTQPSM